MSNPLPMNKPFITLLLLAGCALPISGQAQSLESQIAECRQLSSDLRRLICYDKVGLTDSQVSNTDETATPQSSSPTTAVRQAEPESAPEPVLAPSPNADEAEVPETLGGKRFSAKEKKQDEQSYRAKVVKCVKAGDERYFFYFENDQVWKQVKRGNRRYKNCNFDVTINKDMFGYKMTIDGKRGSERISRKR